MDGATVHRQLPSRRAGFQLNRRTKVARGLDGLLRDLVRSNVAFIEAITSAFGAIIARP